MRRLTRPAVVAVGVALLAACTGGSPEPGLSPAPSSASDGAPETPEAEIDTEAVAATTALHLAAGDVEVEILPIVRAGEHAVLTLDATKTGGDQVLLDMALSGVPVQRLPAFSGLRLVDLERDVVHTIARDANDDGVRTGSGFAGLRAGESMRLQVAYAAPPEDVEALGVFVPGGPYVEEVPVVDGEVPSPELPGAPSSGDDGEPEPLALDAIVEAPVVGLESFTAELAGAVQTLTSTEEVRVTLGSDVLFAVDSADLTDDAQAALDAAAAKLEGREPGTVQVVGHTDDVASDAYNQELSERRAEAVATALAERIDTDRFELVTEGRGESEPLVANTDDESRALNRRVTVTLTSETTTETEVTTAGELPPFDRGPVGTGAEGVLVDNLGTYRITAPEARRVHGHVVLDLQVSPVDEAAENGVSFLDGIWHYRGTVHSVQRAASGLVILRGATAVYPMDYLDGVSDSGTEQWLPLTDLETLSAMAPGSTRTFSVIYPDVGDLDEIAVQVGGGLGSKAFRLTDIPVR